MVLFARKTGVFLNHLVIVTGRRTIWPLTDNTCRVHVVMIYHWPKPLALWPVHLVDTKLICILQSIVYDEVVDTGVPLACIYAR
jgi:hypothetical protein